MDSTTRSRAGGVRPRGCSRMSVWPVPDAACPTCLGSHVHTPTAMAMIWERMTRGDPDTHA